MEIKTLGVVGAGQMGSGISQVAAVSGLSVIMHDIKDEFVERGFSVIEKSLGRMVKKEKNFFGGYDQGRFCSGGCNGKGVPETSDIYGFG